MEYSLGQSIGLSVLNILLVILLAPLLEGLIRKLVAFVHSRIGPPIYQPYLDLLKLLGKEDIVSSKSLLFRYSAILAFAAIIVTAVIVPIGARPPLQGAGDIIVFIYLITLSAVMVMIGGVTSESPFAFIGSAREMMMVLTVEPVIVISLIAVAVKAGSMQFGAMMAYQAATTPSLSMIIVAFTLFLAIVAQLARLPFDIVEADQEIMEGPFIEMSGPKLALFKWMFYAKELIFSAIFVAIFVPWPVTPYFLLNLLITLIKVVVLLVIVGVVHVVNPRLRVDQAIKYFAVMIFVSLIGLAFALVGS
ncbi:NADH-quinone oxidoreductase subunit H [candidate division KSB1 bacterium]|nr:NADH-quinone oxidoreductase subunit H [candidate division KSB1 bacterium]